MVRSTSQVTNADEIFAHARAEHPRALLTIHHPRIDAGSATSTSRASTPPSIAPRARAFV